MGKVEAEWKLGRLLEAKCGVVAFSTLWHDESLHRSKAQARRGQRDETTLVIPLEA